MKAPVFHYLPTFWVNEDAEFILLQTIPATLPSGARFVPAAIGVCLSMTLVFGFMVSTTIALILVLTGLAMVVGFLVLARFRSRSESIKASLSYNKSTEYLTALDGTIGPYSRNDVAIIRRLSKELQETREVTLSLTRVGTNSGEEQILKGFTMLFCEYLDDELRRFSYLTSVKVRFEGSTIGET